jgi:hypothetical protein
MNLLAFIGIPDCAVQDCRNPGIVKVEVESDSGKVWAHLCIGCLKEVGPCLESLSKTAHEDPPLLDGPVESQP